MEADTNFKTYGLTHLALAVADVNRTLRFYKRVFNATVMYQEATWAQIQTPNTNDIIVFEQNAELAGKIGGGIMHFGFRLIDPMEIDKVKKAVELADGKIISFGEFCPGEPYIFFTDPDGYEIEVWYEKIPGDEVVN